MVTTDEHFVCEREPLNSSDRYTMAVLKEGYRCEQLSQILLSFLLENGTIDCVVIGGRRQSSDLPQGGLEIPYKLTINGKHDHIEKLSENSSGL